MKIKRIIFLINKMDQVEYSEIIFNNIKAKVHKMGINIGYKETLMKCIPVSGWEGDNLYKISTNMKWYKQFTLFDLITQLNIKRGNISGKKFRMVLNNAYKISGIGTVACGKVVSGMLYRSIQKNICFLPILEGSNINNIQGYQIITGEVKSMERCYEPLSLALPGDNIGVNIRGVYSNTIRKRGYNHMACGIVLSHEGDCLLPAKSILAKIIVLHNRIKKGGCFIVYSHIARAQCKVKQIIHRMSKKGEMLTNKGFLEVGDFGFIRLDPHPTNLFFIETYAHCTRMGTLLMRDHNITNCIGKILKIEKASLKV